MKARLLRKLRKEFKLVYYPSTSISREQWVLFRPSNYTGKETYFTFKEALNSYLMVTHNHLSNYIQEARSKTIF